MKYLKTIVVLFIVILITRFLSYYINTNIENYDNTRSVLFENIDSIYYINLSHREDRKNQFLDNFNSANENKIHRVDAHYYKNNGAVGCLMSHITALNLALNDNTSSENVLHRPKRKMRQNIVMICIFYNYVSSNLLNFLFLFSSLKYS
jgi:hypothetical protein